MIDEVTLHARLDSELYGSLVHATETIAAAVEADVAGATVFDGPPESLSSYVSAARLGLDPVDEAALQAWPTDDDSLFHVLRDSDRREGVFRPRETMDELEWARHRPFRRLEAVTRVRDAFCLGQMIADDTWCVIAFLRCGENPAFGDSALNSVDRLKPAAARALRRGVQREAQPRAYHLRPQGGRGVPRPMTTAEMLAKLSKTELQVLGYLRNDLTERRIADQIARSPHTVHVHVKNIYRKLGVSSRKDLMTLFSD